MAAPKPIWVRQAEEAKLKSEADTAAAAKAAFDATFKAFSASAHADQPQGDDGHHHHHNPSSPAEPSFDAGDDSDDDLPLVPPGPVDPFKSSAAGPGVAGGSAGAPATFTVLGKDRDGRRVSTGGSRVRVRISPVAGVGGDNLDGAVRDNGEENRDEEDSGEMGELEKEYRTLQANQRNIMETLKQHKDDDASRGQAVKNQKALWDKTLEMRFLLQKAFSTSNKLPKDPTKSRFCSHNQEIEQAYVDLLDSSKQTLGCMLELQEALLERNQAAKGENEMLSDSNRENDEWLEVQKLQRRITLFRNTEIDKWQRKTQVTTGAAALKGKLHAFNQNISDQVAGYMRDPSRMISRMYLRKSAVGVFGEDAAEPGTTEEGNNVEGDPELIDDSEFYHQLLKEFLESCDTGASESAFYALRKKQHKKRKLVDRRASKSRKIRYNVHEKIANFMAPVPMDVPPMASKLFENLFGMGNQKWAIV